MSKQATLHAFFNIPQKEEKDIFIYDVVEKRAYFSRCEEGEFVCSKAGLRLFIKGSTGIPYDFPSVPDMNVALVKSNLQKAVRRKYREEAMESLMYLLATDRIAIFRRFPIIMIEDVCVMDSFPILVWFMISADSYQLTTEDIHILCDILNAMIDTDTVFHNDKSVKAHTPKRESIEDSDVLLALYYRRQYGGMKGDMAMLDRGMAYYLKNPSEVVVTQFRSEYPVDVPPIVAPGIILEAIDFHPYPGMLTYVSKATGYETDVVKRFIWFVDSAYNVRKPWTVENRKKYLCQTEWKKIETSVERFRSRVKI